MNPKLPQIVAISIGALFVLFCFVQVQSQLSTNKEADKLLACEKNLEDRNYQLASVCYSELYEFKKRNCYLFKRALNYTYLGEKEKAKNDLEVIIKKAKKNSTIFSKAKYLYENMDDYIEKAKLQELAETEYYYEEEELKNRENVSEQSSKFHDYFLFPATELKWQNPEKIKVYISKQDSSYEIFKKAFNTWSEKLEGFFKFQFVDSDTDASIVCQTTDSFPSNVPADSTSYSSASGGVIWDSGNMEERFYKQISIEVLAGGNYKEREGQEEVTKETIENEIYNSAVHEIGHALGIKNNSPISKDVMYESMYGANPNHANITKRDIKTLKMLYNVF